MDRYTDNKDGTVTDTKTGLMWQKETPESTYTWKEANTYCHKLELVGYKDWRLPTIQELHSIIDYNQYNPASNHIFDTVSSYYWSSTPSVYYQNFAFGVQFRSGEGSYYSKPHNFYVRAVCGEEEK